MSNNYLLELIAAQAILNASANANAAPTTTNSPTMVQNSSFLSGSYGSLPAFSTHQQPQAQTEPQQPQAGAQAELIALLVKAALMSEAPTSAPPPPPAAAASVSPLQSFAESPGASVVTAFRPPAFISTRTKKLPPPALKPSDILRKRPQETKVLPPKKRQRLSLTTKKLPSQLSPKKSAFPLPLGVETTGKTAKPTLESFQAKWKSLDKIVRPASGAFPTEKQRNEFLREMFARSLNKTI